MTVISTYNDILTLTNKCFTSSIMNCLSRVDQRYLLEHMSEGVPVRSLTRLSGHSPNTVRRYIGYFGEALASFHDRQVRGLTSTPYVQVDEMWGFVYAKRSSRIDQNARSTPPNEVGAYWTWAAIDPQSKLLVTWFVGDRTAESCETFLRDLLGRTHEDLIIFSDNHFAYQDARQRVFGSSGEHVTVEKHLETWRDPVSREKGTRRFKITNKTVRSSGTVDLSVASTSHIERMNLSIRHFNARLHRDRLTFSKRLTNHVHSQAIFAVYYNFVRAHGAFKGPERHWTPAIKAGITNKIWTYDELLDEIGAYWSRKKELPQLRVVGQPEYRPLEVGESSPLPYFVMHCQLHKEAKVHKGTCCNCRQGRGRRGISKNRWYAFESIDAAMACARNLAPLKHSACALCVVGKYRGNSIRQENSHKSRMAK